MARRLLMLSDVLRPELFMTAIPAISQQTPTGATAAQGAPAGAGGLFATFVADAGSGGAVPEAGSGAPAQPGRKRLLAELEASLMGFGVAAAVTPPVTQAAPVPAGTNSSGVSASAASPIAAAGAPPSVIGPAGAAAPAPGGDIGAAPAADEDAQKETDQAPVRGRQERAPQALAAADVTGFAAKSEIVAKSATAAPALAAPTAPAPPAVAGKADKPAAPAADDAKGGDQSKPAGETKPADAAAAKPAPSAGDGRGAAGGDANSQTKGEDRPPQPPARADATLAADRPAAAPQTAAAPATPAAQNPHASAQAAATSAAVQLASEIASHAGARRTRFEVRLDPAELGRIDVRLDIAHDGRLATRLIVERPETLDMLRHDARELTRTLEQAGFQLGQGGLAFQLRDGRRDAWTASEDAGATTSAEEPIEIAPAPYGARTPAVAGGVDRTV